MQQGDLVQARFTSEEEWFNAVYEEFSRGSHTVDSIDGPFDGLVEVGFVRPVTGSNNDITAKLDTIIKLLKQIAK